MDSDGEEEEEVQPFKKRIREVIQYFNSLVLFSKKPVRSSKDSYDGNDGNDGVEAWTRPQRPHDDMPPLGAVYTTRSKTRASLIPTNVEEEKEDMEVAIRESQRHRKGAHYINMWG